MKKNQLECHRHKYSYMNLFQARSVYIIKKYFIHSASQKTMYLLEFASVYLESAYLHYEIGSLQCHDEPFLRYFHSQM